jgi:hypothetical protein
MCKKEWVSKEKFSHRNSFFPLFFTAAFPVICSKTTLRPVSSSFFLYGIFTIGPGPLPQYRGEGRGQVGQGRLRILHHHHALRRRLRIHRPYCPGIAVT